MQIGRLFETVYILLHQQNVTAKQLAEHFEVSQRTIYRDIELLGAYGIPIYTNKGRGGGIGLIDSFVLNRSLLTSQEQKDILTGLQSLQAVHYTDAGNLLAKLCGLFNQEAASWVEIDFSSWKPAERDDFNLVKSAILRQEKITFHYYNSRGERSRREVEPLQLYYKYRTWYLWGICAQKQAVRLFKLSRMKGLAATGKGFERKPVPELIPEEAEKRIAGSTAETTLDELKANDAGRENAPHFEKNVTKIDIKIDASQAYRVYDEYEDGQIVREEDGSFLVTAFFPEDEWVYGHILSYGPFAQVVEPARVRAIIRDKLEKTLRRYL